MNETAVVWLTASEFDAVIAIASVSPFVCPILIFGVVKILSSTILSSSHAKIESVIRAMIVSVSIFFSLRSQKII